VGERPYGDRGDETSQRWEMQGQRKLLPGTGFKSEPNGKSSAKNRKEGKNRKKRKWPPATLKKNDEYYSELKGGRRSHGGRDNAEIRSPLVMPAK